MSSAPALPAEQQELLTRSLRHGYVPLGRRDAPLAAELVKRDLGVLVTVNVSGYIEHRFVPDQKVRELAAGTG
jgi:hypothetical protein